MLRWQVGRWRRTGVEIKAGASHPKCPSNVIKGRAETIDEVVAVAATAISEAVTTAAAEAGNRINLPAL